jgi:hypothetical protein
VHRPAFALVLALGACSASPKAADAPSPTPNAPSTPAAPKAASSVEPAAGAEPGALGRACGALDCLAFESPEQALGHVLLEKPRVLGVGEAHAQARDPKVHSATRRFGETLLPKLKGQATDIVIELLIGSGRCGKEREQAVRERQEPVTEGHAKENQNEFVTLGHAARALGIEPHALEPTCDEYQAVLDAGSADIARMLELIADTTAVSVEKILAAPRADNTTLVLTYGGARHNDITPRPAMEAWSYGPRLAQRTGGRYVELDLIVPEFIKDSEAWRALPWHAHYDPARLGEQTVLYRPEPHSYVLIFARSAARSPATPAPPAAPTTKGG